MQMTPTYAAEQLARDYTRDRIRDAEARRAARAARAAARERRYAAASIEPVRPARRRWVLAVRTSRA